MKYLLFIIYYLKFINKWIVRKSNELLYKHKLFSKEKYTKISKLVRILNIYYINS